MNRAHLKGVLEAFAERAHPPHERKARGAGADSETEFSGWAAHADHAIEMPPWRDRLPNGELVDLIDDKNYFSESTFLDARRAWLQSRAGGGLWDDELSPPTPAAIAREVRARIDREDAGEVAAFVRRRGHELPVREREVYALWWVQRTSYSKTARRLGLSVNTVRDLVRRVRARVEDWRRTVAGRRADRQGMGSKNE